MSYRWLLSVCALFLLQLAVPSIADSTASPKTGAPAGTTSVTVITLVTVGQGDVKLEELERVAAQQANAERLKAGLSPLTYSSDLADVARAHSLEMRDRKFFGHDSPTSGLRTALDRYRAAYTEVPPVVAENLYGSWGGEARQLGDADIRHAHVSLMHSPTHKANILFPNLTHIGVGIVTNASGDIWLTEMFVFAKPTSKLLSVAQNQDKATNTPTG
ncbi:hypothetical protein EON83_01490 [bacterium]|nr:MAG: hypothetical protein EON83_01490 [bacterium]